MISLSELRVIEDTFFGSDLLYYKPSLYPLLEKFFKEENEYSEATLVKLKNILKSDEIAYKKILSEDIDRLRDDIDKTPKQFDEQLWRDMLPRIREQVKKHLGLDFKPRSIFFEDSFPRGLIGFEKKGASSVTIFEGNKDAGIYFLNKRVSSFFTPILLIHEQLHSCLSQNKSKDQMYIEWFEEGLCQWYSMKIYHELTKNMEVLDLYRERCWIYSHVKPQHNFTRRYYEYMKKFSQLFLHGGPKQIGEILLDYLSDEREKVNAYLEKDLPIEHLPTKDVEQFLVTFTQRMEPETLPPVEYLVLSQVQHTTNMETVLAATGLPPKLATKVIFALNLKGMIVLKGKELEMNWRKKDLFEKKLIKPHWPIKR